MTDTLDLIDERIPRDRWKRPLVIPPGGGKPTAYIRCTTFIDCLDDKYKLNLWQQRMVAIGLADRPDLMLSVAAHRDDKDHLDHLCTQAKDAAKAGAAATTGTALHKLAEQADQGKDPGVLPGMYAADIAVYTEATKAFRHLSIEQFLVLDDMKIGGTPDRISTYEGRNYIVDIKTGATIHFGILAIAMQLAVYAHCAHYDIGTGTRTPLPDVDTDRAIVIHLPAGQNKAELLWIDIAAGWEAVQTAADVRRWRARKNLATSFGGYMAEAALTEAFSTGFDLPNAIATANSVEELTDLWARHQDMWEPSHTGLAAARKALLTGVTP